jgi:hypothetical protein
VAGLWPTDLHDATASLMAMALAVTGEVKHDTDDRARGNGKAVATAAPNSRPTAKYLFV